MLPDLLDELVEALARLPGVRLVGLSGGDRPLPEAGQGDVDLFVLCKEIPTEEERASILRGLPGDFSQAKIGSLESGHWGIGDSLLMAGVETWLLYMTVRAARQELEAVLGGQFLDRLDGYYYPTGRCATWKSMRGLYDPDGLLPSLKSRLEPYPPDLARAMIEHHMRALVDVEDLQRAVLRRDLLFFHFALDRALDHFLQALFALNREYFPSRKRSEEYIARFALKPAECGVRICRVVELGAGSESLEQAYNNWSLLVHELQGLAGTQP